MQKMMESERNLWKIKLKKRKRWNRTNMEVIMIYLIIGIVILIAPFIWMEIAERRIQEWEKEK